MSYGNDDINYEDGFSSPDNLHDWNDGMGFNLGGSMNRIDWTKEVHSTDIEMSLFLEALLKGSK